MLEAMVSTKVIKTPNMSLTKWPSQTDIHVTVIIGILRWVQNKRLSDTPTSNRMGALLWEAILCVYNPFF